MNREKVFKINIKEFTQKWKDDIKKEIARSGIQPKLGIIQVGENEASQRYVRNKIRDCAEVGIETYRRVMIGEVSTEDVIGAINELSQIPCDGIIVQLPLPKNISLEKVKTAIPAGKDVDGFGATSPFDPCTPMGIIKYIDACGFDLEGKNITIFGRSDIVGKPLAKMMLDRNATITLCHSHTKNEEQFIRSADLIVSAVGKANFLNCYSIYVPVVDVGINFVDGKMVGDCFNTEDRDVTPVPGGVGLLTRCALLENVWRAAKERNE